MDELKAALACADEAYLTGMSNKGLYKRACKDIDGAQVDVRYAEDAAEVSLCGETCKIKVPLWESSCSCPSRSVCRHIIGAILRLKENFSEDVTEEMEDEEVPKEPEKLSETLMDTLRSITPQALKRALGKELAKTVQDVQQGRILLTESSILSAQLPDGTAVRLLHPLEFSTCACHRKELCAHKAAAVLAWQTAQGILDPQDLLEQAQTLSKADTTAIHSIAQQAQAVLCEVLRWGLVRMPDNLPEHLEVAAVQCHSAKMAEGERLLRELGSRLQNCRERRAAFHTESFLRRFCECADYLDAMQEDTLTEASLGAFRRSYSRYEGDLDILPIGMRSMQGGDYEGEVYYFLNMDESAQERFLSYSDLRPVFYDSVKKRGRRSAVIPWSLNMPLRSAMRKRMVLQNAKVSDGKLSSSQETFVAASSTANLDCEEIRRLLYSDFRRLAVAVSRKQAESELQRLCFVHPQQCTASGFDRHKQQFSMTLLDGKGNHITVKARYAAENKAFIELLEHIGKRMTEQPEKPYVLFCSAYFEEGALCLYPIEIYDFIRVTDHDDGWQLPPQYEQTNGRYAGMILRMLEDAQGYLCEVLQAGLQSAHGTDTGRRLAVHAAHCGLHGLSERLGDFADAVDGYRHSLTGDCHEALCSAARVYRYLDTGRRKLEIVSALEYMKGET